MARLAVVDAPLDCSGTGRGEEHAPAALRAAGLVERLAARDAGEADARIRDTRRDRDTGVVGAAEVRAATTAIASCVRQVLEARERPLVVGGDCTLLLGVFRALPRGSGLWFVDGHADFLDGETRRPAKLPTWTSRSSRGTARRRCSSQTNRYSSRPLSICLGIAWTSLMPTSPPNARVDPAINAQSTPEVRERGAASVGADAAARLAGRPAWLHLDLDVLDERVLPAVSYPQPLGLDRDKLVALVGPLVAQPTCWKSRSLTSIRTATPTAGTPPRSSTR